MWKVDLKVKDDTVKDAVEQKGANTGPQIEYRFYFIKKNLGSQKKDRL